MDNEVLKEIETLRNANARLLSIIEEKDAETVKKKNIDFVQLYKKS